MTQRRKIIIAGKKGTGRPTSRSRFSGERIISWLLSALVAFALGLGLSYWWWTPKDALVTVSSGGQEASGYPTTDGVFRNTTQLAVVLERLGVEEKDRLALLGKARLRDKTTVEAEHLYRIEYADEDRDRVRSFTYEYNDSILHRLRFLPYVDLEVIERRITEHPVAYAGVITDNFWLSVLDSDSLHHALIPLVEDALKWTVDLFHLRVGDRFKLLYTEQRRDGRVVGVSRLDAVRIETAEKTSTVYAYQTPDTLLYLDYNGRGVRRRFLRAPVKFAIISSPFSRNRVHPVTGVNKPHGGTDFAAPSGAPILALADAVVTRKMEDVRFNGNYVELKHAETYSTMYLHMEGFAPGLTVGKRVLQGEVIGYVGSTGQTTGPHVCLRFRDGGEEVDFQQYRDDRTSGSVTNLLTGFPARRDSLANKLEELTYGGLLF